MFGKFTYTKIKDKLTNKFDNKTNILKPFFIIIPIILIILFVFNYSFSRNNYHYTNLSIPTNADVQESSESKYIKWVECNLTLEVLEKTSKLDINSHVNNEDIQYNWIELISYLACKTGNNFKKFKQKDLDELIAKLKSGQTMELITEDMKYYSYYYESYSAILGEFIGTYHIGSLNEDGEKIFDKKYGIKAFLPVAKNYSFSHYDDFGASRSYGYKRTHLGNDLMGNIGTPIIAVESGIIESARMESIWWLAYWNSKL